VAATNVARAFQRVKFAQEIFFRFHALESVRRGTITPNP
jgi:hypothetical protein